MNILMSKRGVYKGVSSFEFQRNKSFKLRDVELVKMDLLNHIFTKQGERVMMPRFGTIIPELVFEPLTPELVDTVVAEITRVIHYDPRVELINVQSTPDYDTGMLTVALECRFIELNMTDIMYLNIEFER